MKKTLKLMALCVVAVAMSASFAACGDDDDDNHNNGGNTSGNDIPSTAMSSTTGRNLSKIRLLGCLDIFFDYDTEGRVAKMYYSVNDLLQGNLDIAAQYDYYTDSIEATHSRNDSIILSRSYTLTDGLITHLKETTGSNVTHLAFQYQNRQLINVTLNGSPWLTVTWEDGNIIQSNSADKEIRKFTYDETAYSNNRVELIHAYNPLSGDYGLVLQGYYGNGTRHRHSTMSKTVEGSPTDYTDYSLSYHLDTYNDVKFYTTHILNEDGTENHFQRLYLAWK